MSTNTALDDIKNRVEGLSDLCPEYMHLAIRNSVRNCDFDCQRHGEEEDCGPGQSDGARIAHSLADVPKLLAALEAVEALHVPVLEDGKPVGCRVCDWGEDDYYPCQTLTAIEEALR
ncbi:hypothetical protein [Arthrobacter luteolus]|uniref:hypothetical protein n=1 Tax=Arthrobacter luteolus TaxID=98672 RepID=UPI000830AA61|nr:hypothetical protein [Arthrobacter luteolus]